MLEYVQRDLDRRYAMARAAWAGDRKLRDAACALGMTERAYCDAYVRGFPPLTWTSSTSDLRQPDADAAYASCPTT